MEIRRITQEAADVRTRRVSQRAVSICALGGRVGVVSVANHGELRLCATSV